MPADANSVLQEQVTKTAAFDGPTFDLKTGTPRGGLYDRVIYKDAATSSGAGSARFGVQHSDNGSTWSTIALSDPITLGTAAVAREIWIPFETSKRYVRHILESITGTGATITYSADISLSRP